MDTPVKEETGGREVPAFVVENLHATSNWLAMLALGAVIAVILVAFSLMDHSNALLKISEREKGAWLGWIMGASIGGLLLSLWATSRLCACVVAIWKVRGEATMAQVENALLKQNRLWKGLAVTSLYHVAVFLASAPLQLWNAQEEKRLQEKWEKELEEMRAYRQDGPP